MPEAITIKEEPTPALSQEDQNSLSQESTTTDESSGLLAGKYKTQEDLEKGYLELQKQLGKNETAETTEAEVETETETEAETETEVSDDPKEIYGDFIGGRFEENGIDFQDMNKRWQETGQLSEEDYGELENAGFSKDMVDAYLSGVQYKAAQDTELATKEVMEIKKEFGGEKEYDAMLQWAGQNLEQEEIDAFNTMLKTSNTMQARIAIAGLQAKYQANAAREPKLVGGRAPRKATDKFESNAQLVAAMQDERYALDPAYRKKISDKLSRSNIL